MRRLGRDPVMGDVVRRRLEELVAEIAPRHAGPDPDAGAQGDRDGALPGSPAGDATRQRPPRRVAIAHPAPGPATIAGWARRGWEFGRSHVAVVAILGLLGVGWALVGMGSARTTPVTPTAVPVTASTPTALATPVELQVHVVGAVTRPGVVRLPVGARVADAVAAAGGTTADAKLGDLNLAAVVADGAQVVVGGDARVSAVRDGGGGAAGSGSGGAGQVDLNTATREQLDGLPGVGPVTAERILAWRAAHQRFSRVEELQEVEGIGAKTFAQLKPHVRV